MKLRIATLVLFTSVLAGCGDSTGGNCVTPNLTGGWTESDRSSMSLTQTCDGSVTGRWTTKTAAGVTAAEWNLSGQVTGSRFTWVGQCVDQSCTYATVTADGSDGTGMDIVDSGNRLEGFFSVPNRANGAITMRRDAASGS